jgi:hypothetical protein
MSDEELSSVEQEIDAFMDMFGSQEQEKMWYARHGILLYQDRIAPVDMSAECREPLALDDLYPEDKVCDPSLD